MKLNSLLTLSSALLCASYSVNLYANDTFTAEDIFQLEYVNNPQISPDGKKIIYLRSGYDIMKDSAKRSIWMYDVKQNQHYPLLADEHNYGQPTWSPDAKKIAFTSNRSGSNQLYVYWLEQDKLALLTQLPKSIRSLSWSNNSNNIAFTMNVPAGKTDFVKSVQLPKKPKGASWSKPVKVYEKARYQADGSGYLEPAYRHVFVVPANGGTARQLTTGNFQHYGPLAWSPNDSKLAFSSDQNADWEYRATESDLYEVSINEGSYTQLTQLPGRESSPTYSANGKQIAFIARDNAPVPYINSTLNIITKSSKKIANVSNNFDRSVADYKWTGKGDFVIQYDDFGKRKLAKLSFKGKVSDLVDSLSGTSIGRPYISGSFSLAKNGAIAYTKGSSQRPADLAYLYKGKSKTLTALNEDLLGHKQLGEVHELNVKSSFDNENIQGWYITPPNFDKTKKYPLLLEIHGGPHLAYGPSFTAELQRYASEGYVVVYVNYRGSTSYGKDFALLLDGKYSSKEDFADHNSAVDAMIAKGFIDEENLFIAGGSAGGIATAYAIGLTDRFNAAAITKPVINWLSKTLTADSYIGQIRNQFPGMPWDNVEHYWQRSPLSLVGNVTTPALLMTGEEDRRTPISESEQFYQALKLQKVDTVLIRVPGSPHGIAGRPSRMISKVEHTLAWFERYKK
ncbi:MULTISPECIES: S9 family peptidase [unclassified Pseudoalteromonas]|uniref:S9 family peptidase n=1 Tax=unclassified Pseudoalteromonas TaxID=194690 RepID=UPI000C087282|nr:MULTISPECIES: S9 family peptidase [unclassified Pseudoalteromonas]MDP2633880.1 S9 family peptidase [Pseudoalteromonas sp. 1_MG-2023]PHN88675.1 peptidase S9 family protein [Pseudoalteromonas sp. 3D05]